MLKYEFCPCDANGAQKLEQAMCAEATGIETAIQVMCNMQAASYVVCASRGVGNSTPMVQVKPAPAGGWDVWSNEILETEDPYQTLAGALLEAVDVVDEYIDEHSNWS